MRESSLKQERVSIPYFEGINSAVQHAISRKTEMIHMENARAPVVGVLEKREGQAVFGTDTDGGVFETLGNSGLVYWANGGNDTQGLLRISTVNGTVSNIYFLNKNLSPTAFDTATITENIVLSIV